MSESPQNRARRLVTETPALVAIRKAGEEAIDKIDGGETPVVALRGGKEVVYVDLKLSAAEVAIVVVALTRMAILGDDLLDRIPAAETLDTLAVQASEAACDL